MTDHKEGFDVDYFRRKFSYFYGPNKSICFDGVGGTQVPDTVINAIKNHLLYKNGNRGGIFHRSKLCDDIVDGTREIVADFLNASDPAEILLGSNFTNQTFAISRALSKTWNPGDEIVVTRLDHDANVSPWLYAAEDVGVTVRFADIDVDDLSCQVTPEYLEEVLSERTRLVAFCASSSSVGTRPDVKRLTELAHSVGALVYVDAVAYAPHAAIDVVEWDADFVGCSGYKFFGPHIGFLWGRRALLEQIDAYKIRPAPNLLPVKWENGAQPYELMAGLTAALKFVAEVGQRHPEHKADFPQLTGRKLDLRAGMAAIEAYELDLTWRLIDEIKKRPLYKIWGVTDRERAGERLPPIAVSIDGVRPDDLALHLDRNGIDVWSRTVYSISLSERLGLETKENRERRGGFIRIGLNLYNTWDEIETMLQALDNLPREIEQQITREPSLALTA